MLKPQEMLDRFRYFKEGEVEREFNHWAAKKRGYSLKDGLWLYPNGETHRYIQHPMPATNQDDMDFLTKFLKER